MKLKILLIGIVIILISWIASPSLHMRPIFNVHKTDYDDFVYQIQQSFANWMKKELNLNWMGRGGVKHEKIEGFRLNFEANRRATVEEARAITLLAVHKFADMINAHEKIRPYLLEYPFPLERIIILTRFLGTLGPKGDGSVFSAFHLGSSGEMSILSYDSYDSFKGNSFNFLEESHTEAIKLNNESPVQNPAIHLAKAYEEPMDKLLKALACEIHNEVGIYCWSIGAKMVNDIEGVNAKFSAFRTATQEEARELEIFIVEKILKAINSNEQLRPYLREYPFPLERLKIRICFTNKRYIPYIDGTMESVVLENEEITYFQEVKIPRMDVEEAWWMREAQLFGKEKYQDALKIVQAKL
jgi:hypothetical protein